jgi:hypothetical protein
MMVRKARIVPRKFRYRNENREIKEETIGIGN